MNLFHIGFLALVLTVASAQKDNSFHYLAAPFTAKTPIITVHAPTEEERVEVLKAASSLNFSAFPVVSGTWDIYVVPDIWNCDSIACTDISTFETDIIEPLTKYPKKPIVHNKRRYGWWDEKNKEHAPILRDVLAHEYGHILVGLVDEKHLEQQAVMASEGLLPGTYRHLGRIPAPPSEPVCVMSDSDRYICHVDFPK